MPPLSSYTWMTLNYARHPRIQFGPQDHLQLNHCVLARWHFVRDHILVKLIHPHQSQCLHGKICHLQQVMWILIRLDLDSPIDLNGHVLSPFTVRDFHYQDCHFHSIAHLMCYRYAVLNDFKLLATSVRKWSKHLTEFPIVRFVTHNWQTLCRSILGDIYSHLCLNDATVNEALVNTGPRPFILYCQTPQGGLDDILNDILIATRVALVAGRLTCTQWMQPSARHGGLRNARR